MLMQQEARTMADQAKTDDQKKGVAATQTSLAGMNRTFSALFGVLQDTDMPATTQAIAAVGQAQVSLKKAVQAWSALKSGLKQ